MLRSVSRWALPALFLCFTIGAIGSASAVEPSAPDKLLSRMDAIGIEVSKILGQKFRDSSEFHKIDHGALVEHYSGGGEQLAWVSEHGLNQKALDAMSEIGNAAEWGLRVEDYKVPAATLGEKDSGLSIEEIAQLEVDMSYAVLAYARHASGGRVRPSDLSENLDYNPPYADPLDVMGQAVKTDSIGTYLTSLHPRNEQFIKLKKLLAKIRAGEDKADDVVIIPAGPTIRPGDIHPDVTLIRARLKVKTPEEADLDVYDEEIVEAVRTFQESKGLRPDGIVGGRTRAAMNGNQVVPQDQTATILSNMERWRWLPQEFASLHFQNNIPEFKTRMRKNGDVIFEERIVVGKVANKTPGFVDEMEKVVFNPYWYPPRSIIINEIIPGAQRSSGFLRSQGLQIVNARGRVVDPYNVDWYSTQALKYQLRQPPGRGNALGVVKFLFPNKHAVYMHDTPSKSLFNNEVRTYSHGCMRVRNPRDMAEVIMGEIEGWDRAKIDQIIAGGANTKVELSRHIPVYVTYFTMSVGDDGKPKFFKDVYGHDKRTIAALEGRMMPKEVNRKVTTARIRREPSFSAPFEGGGGLFDSWFND